MKCVNCGKEINDNSNFCEFCGFKIVKNNFCGNCGSKLDGGNFCSGCGTRVENNNQNNLDTINSMNQINNQVGVPLVITREKSFFGAAISFKVYVDGNLLGSLKNNSSLFCNVALGNHEVIIKSLEKDTIAHITVNESCRGVDIIILANMGFVAATAKIRNIIYK